MPEREYFSVRYLIPGSTFLILIIGYNIVPLLRLTSSQQISTIFGAVIGVLSSPTIGFLISQLWWWRFHDSFGIYEMGGVEPLAKKLSLKTEKKEDRMNAFKVYDYVLHWKLHSESELKGLSDYAFRRYDAYVLLSCTKSSLILGIVFGLPIRLASLVFYCSHFVNKFSFLRLDAMKMEIGLWVFITIVAAILILVIYQGQKLLWREHKDIHTAIIRAIIHDPEFDEKELKTIFPECFKT